jgi:GxxExxY protein
MNDLLLKDETYAIRGVVFEVHGEMGSGFLEAVYQECMEKELAKQGIPFEAQKDISVLYKGQPLEQVYKPDLICYGKIILELKAVKNITPQHRAQVINYLKATNMRLGLLINFGSHHKATIQRLVL